MQIFTVLNGVVKKAHTLLGGVTQRVASIIQPVVHRISVHAVIDTSIRWFDKYIVNYTEQKYKDYTVRSAGPRFRRYHWIMLDLQTMSPEVSIELLTFLMSLKNKDAKKGLSHFSNITDSAFFLAMNDKYGKELHKRWSRHLNLTKIQGKIDQNIAELYKMLDDQDCTSNFNSIAQQSIIDLFTDVLYGITIESDLQQELMREPEMQSASILMAFIPDGIRHLAQLFLPKDQLESVRINGIKTKIFQVLVAQLQQLKKNPAVEENFITEIIKHRYPKKTITDLTDNEIEQLALDPEVRLSASSILGIKNLTDVLVPMLAAMSYTELFPELQKEVACCEGATDLFNRQKMPILHAYYLNALALGVKMPIARYVTENKVIGEMTVPARSLIVFDLATFMNPHKLVDYNPRGYLDDNFSLRQDSALNQGRLVPFGIPGTPHACPAAKVSEFVFKSYLAAVAKNPVPVMHCIDKQSGRLSPQKNQCDFTINAYMHNEPSETDKIVRDWQRSTEDVSFAESPHCFFVAAEKDNERLSHSHYHPPLYLGVSEAETASMG